VTAVDCLIRERPVSSGGNDRSVRLWKVIEETQLVFQGHKLVSHLFHVVYSDLLQVSHRLYQADK